MNPLLTTRGSDWALALELRGLTPLSPTTAVPVELYALLPDGRAVHFRCRGTSVTLRLYAAADVAVAIGVRETVVTELPVVGEVWVPLRDALGVPGRAVFTSAPLAAAAIDGRERFGWTGHEAGLLRGTEALPFLDELLAVLVPESAPRDLALAV
jgi:hypothetical protein